MTIARELVRNAVVVAAGQLWSIGRKRVGGRVVAFHDIADSARFRRKMEWLRERYDLVSLDGITTSQVSEIPRVAVTLDDGDVSWYEHAAPILEALGIPAVFFVSSGFVGLEGPAADEYVQKRLLRRRKLCPLTKRQLLEISRNGLFEIGGHTAHHVDLGGRWDRVTLEREIDQDKRRLEDWTGRPLRWFAYPFGRRRNVSAAAEAHVEEAGYLAGFTIVPGRVEAQAHAYRIGRSCLEDDQSDLVWEAVLRGGHDFRRWI